MTHVKNLRFLMILQLVLGVSTGLPGSSEQAERVRDRIRPGDLDRHGLIKLRKFRELTAEPDKTNKFSHFSQKGEAEKIKKTKRKKVKMQKVIKRELRRLLGQTSKMSLE